MDKVDIIQGDNVTSITPTVVLEEGKEKCIYLLIICNTTDIPGKNATMEFQGSFMGSMIESSKEATVELACDDEAWKVLKKDEEELKDEVTEVSWKLDSSSPICPPGSTPSPYDPTLCYFLVNETNSFQNAELNCQSKSGGHLASIKDDLTNFWIGELARSQYFGEFWIGATNSSNSTGETCHSWYWTSGREIISYSNWAPLDPYGADCGFFSVKYDYIWQAYDCSTKMPSLCQVHAVYSVCDPDWHLFNGTQMCYKTIVENMTFDSAEDYCKNNGGHLASIHSLAENEFVIDISKSNIIVDYTHLYQTVVWIGLHHVAADPANVWTWTDGTPFDYNNWDGDGSVAAGTSYNVILFSDPISDRSSYKQWGGKALSTTRAFVCKKPPHQITSESNNVNPTCPVGSTPSSHDRTLCYFVIRELNSFQNSELKCSLSGAHLPRITDGFTNYWIGEVAKSNNLDNVWVGATNNLVSGDNGVCHAWYWTNNRELVSFTDWGHNEPSIGNCAVLSVSVSYSWYSYNCAELLSSICQLPALSSPCDSDWIPFNETQMCYKTFIDQLNFNDAESVCQGQGGHLASIHSESENDFVVSISKSGVLLTKDQRYSIQVWIGLYSTAADPTGSNWKWTDGTVVDYVYWGPYGGNTSAASHGSIFTDPIEGTNYYKYWDWNTPAQVLRNRGFVCKKSPIKVP
ncbi:hypothetical protein FO519_007455 [Halicephalobus sp. NKZ332]|nr:hypothetical protein FO519_007455 [Halicephalobus sp. NKZ332]